jgi:hypothetical protein
MHSLSLRNFLRRVRIVVVVRWVIFRARRMRPSLILVMEDTPFGLLVFRKLGSRLSPVELGSHF